MNKPANERLTQEVSREVCRRTNSKAMIVGSIDQTGESYSLRLKAMNCFTLDTIAAVKTEARNLDQVLHALDKADEQLRGKLGESLPLLQQFNKPLPDATTASLEALQAYAQAQRRMVAGEEVEETIELLKRAVELDPNFAIAYSTLGHVYLNSHHVELGTENLTRAYELRNRVSERERFSIETGYYRSVTGETAKAVKACEDGLKSYPDSIPLLTWLGFSYLDAGQPEKAVLSFERVRRLAPDNTAPYTNLMAAYLAMNRLDEARTLYDEARKRNLDGRALRANRYIVAFLESDEAAMQEQMNWAHGKPENEDRFLLLAADTEASRGQLATSRELIRQAQARAEEAGGKERAFEYEADSAWREAEVGNFVLARQQAASALNNTDDRIVKETSAIALARAGDIKTANKLANELENAYPLDNLVQTYIVPTVRALTALQQGNASSAIDTLKPALSSELSTGDVTNMEATYVRGLAYLQLHDGAAAAAEFQKLIDHSGIVENLVTGPLVHLQLARAEEMMGNREAARTEYQNFLALWKDADPDIPALKQAKAEYAKLNGGVRAGSVSQWHAGR
jgi:pentatricopeptide repeat protein